MGDGFAHPRQRVGVDGFQKLHGPVADFLGGDVHARGFGEEAGEVGAFRIAAHDQQVRAGRDAGRQEVGMDGGQKVVSHHVQAFGDGVRIFQSLHQSGDFRGPGLDSTGCRARKDRR